ncbi:hypothetical protein O9K51_07742 [Purpureocillium lavendulum]|uniref:Oxo-4-hydroxy-4-carboxy-5-ureidoimidazoline decarboxylase domain-containing protein n=1 Tax=Purpureocillium lavendulum TaxID=1247861 RepID=A0AB34FMH6_9HYPO|nr:hypothetical protein O9K51_07742 [Purpureocillium lavendulum]
MGDSSRSAAMAQQLPHIGDLHSYSDLEQTQVLDLLFEPSPAIHTALVPVIRTAQYQSYPDLIDACQIQLLSLAADSKPSPGLLAVLGSHPRLGAKKVDSAQSVAEQANLQGEGEELARLNEEYERRFPGLRYVVFVNGRGRPEIMQDMRTRIDRGDYSKEITAALQIQNRPVPIISLRPPAKVITRAREPKPHRDSYVNSHAKSSFGSRPLSASRSAPSGDKPSAVLPNSIPKSQYTSSGSSANPSSRGASSKSREPKPSSPASSWNFFDKRRWSVASREGPGLSRWLILIAGSSFDSLE